MLEIRVADVNDAEDIRRIYGPYVIETAISFEYQVPSVEDFKKRIENTLKLYPYLVAIQDGRLVGYAYAGPFHSRAAYSHSVELSIYLDANMKRQGLGRKLYNKLFELLLAQNIYNVHACIASPDGEDDRVSDDSEHFHERLGFKRVGRHERCGYKFGKWYSIIWMDKRLTDLPDEAPRVIPFGQMLENMEVTSWQEN